MATIRVDNIYLLIVTVLITQGINSTNGQFSGWDEYLSSWLGEVESQKMFPFGELYHDTVLVPPTLGAGLQMTFTLPYYGRMYTSAFVNVDGHIELSNSDPATNTAKGARTEWPNALYPEEGDPPFVAPYMGVYRLSGLPADPGRIYWRSLDPHQETEEQDREIGMIVGGSGVFWRLIDPENDTIESDREIAEGMLEHLSDVIHSHVLGTETFEGTHGLIVTWSDMQYSGCPVESQSCPTNTLQAAIVTDGSHTFAVYNYYRLDWIGSFDQGYEPENGVTCGASNGNCRPAQAGFNAGGAMSFHPLPFSNTGDVRRLADVGGRFVYKIDSHDIQRGGCTNQTDVDPIDWPLVVSPDHGTMLGGQAVYVSGPCFIPSIVTSLHCRFGDVITEGWLIEGDHVRAVCVTPFSKHTGHVRLDISLDGGQSWPYRGWFNFYVPSAHTPTVTLTDPARWYSRAPGDLSLAWDPAHLEDGDFGWADNTTYHTVDVTLYAYVENLLANGTTGELRELAVLEEDLDNAGQYGFTVTDVACPGVADCDWGLPLPAGLIQIRQHGNGHNPSLWSTPFPLGWYVDSAWTVGSGATWADERCAQWADLEAADVSWQVDLAPCPLTEAHALADKGGFVLAADCNLTWPICPSDHRDGHLAACYDQVMPLSHTWPSISHCCYDDHGELLYSGDSADLSHSSPSHRAAQGGHSLASHGGVPMLSHFTWDIMYRVVCCEWASDPANCQDHYLGMRPTKDMAEYAPPGITSAYGDPHFRTFDGIEYTFNGRGEYWLLKVHDMEADPLDNVNIQARMERPKNDTPGDLLATVMTVVAMQEGYADSMTVPVVEVAMAMQPAHTDLLLMVDGTVHDVTSEHRRRLEIPYRDDPRTIVVMNNDALPPSANRQANLTVILPSGVTVQVAYRDGALHVMTSLPDIYWEYTSGLFGYWNGEPADDLKTPNGGNVNDNIGTEGIHRQFGEMWVVSETDSRFTYYGSLSASDYHDPDFTPHFSEPSLPPGSPITETDVDQACGENFVCRFDFKTTLSRDLAQTTLELQGWSRQVVNMSAPVAVCPYLSIPLSRREVTSYREGGTVSLLGCAEGYTLQGPDMYICVPTGDGTADWEPALDTVCTENSEIKKENQNKILRIVIPVIIAVVVVVALSVGGYFIHKRRMKNKRADSTAPTRRGTSRSNSHRRSYSGGSALDASTLERSFNPVPVLRPHSEPGLIAQGFQQGGTLVGSGALGAGTLGSMETFKDSPQLIDTRLRAPSPDNVSFGDSTFDHDFNPAAYPDALRTDRQRSESQTQATLENNMNILMAGDTGYDSSGLNPMMNSLSNSRVSVNFAPGYSNPGYAELQQSRTSLNVINQNAVNNRSHQDLINLNGLNHSNGNLNQMHAQNHSRTSLNQPDGQQINPALSASQRSLHRSHASLAQTPRFGGSTPSLGHINHAASTHSLTSQRMGGSQQSLGQQSQLIAPLTVPNQFTDTTV